MVERFCFAVFFGAKLRDDEGGACDVLIGDMMPPEISKNIEQRNPTGDLITKTRAESDGWLGRSKLWVSVQGLLRVSRGSGLKSDVPGADLRAGGPPGGT